MGLSTGMMEISRSRSKTAADRGGDSRLSHRIAPV